MRARADDLLDARLRHRLARRDDGGSFRLGGLEHGAGRDGVRRACAYAETRRAFSRVIFSSPDANAGGASSRIAAAVPGCAVSGATAADTSPTNARRPREASRFFS